MIGFQKIDDLTPVIKYLFEIKLEKKRKICLDKENLNEKEETFS